MFSLGRFTSKRSTAGNPLPAYRTVSRRALLRSASVASLALLIPGVANAATKKKPKPKPKPAAPTKAPSGAVPATTAAPAVAVPKAPAGGGASFDAVNEVVVSFTYQPEGGGGFVKNPYVVVWIENEGGKLLKTVSINAERGRGSRWLEHLTRWFTADGARISAGGVDTAESITSATKLPGAYNVRWDGSDDQGVPLVLGTYYVCIEAARERGPREASLIREKVDLGSLTKVSPADSGELVKATIALRKRA
jgi:hypothetical protein